ncbi:arginase family protein [Streptomyces sp. NPDC002785]|uniref:arginase family protein n=1 Tax=Streptomyces sp. NPDC002785 TaxID=3154543 RepID=UPI00331B2D49
MNHNSRPAPIGALDATKIPRFADLGTFARIPDIGAVGDYDIAVLGVPFDGGTSYRPGARFGPMGIRQASRHLRPRFHVELGTAPLEAVQVVDAGDVPYFNAPITHGTVFRRAFEEGLLAEDKSIHLGIRGPIYDQKDLVNDKAFGFRAIRAADLDVIGIEGAVDAIRRRVGDAPVYISIDIDVLDPAFAPGTGTPEMGGFNSRELLRLLRSLDGLDIVGGDVVEVAPAYDHAEITCLAAATVVFDLVTLMAKNHVACPVPASADHA